MTHSAHPPVVLVCAEKDIHCMRAGVSAHRAVVQEPKQWLFIGKDRGTCSKYKGKLGFQ